MKTTTEFDKFLSEIVLKTTLGTQGWDTAIRDIATNLNAMVYVYLYDEPTGWAWLAGISRQDWLRGTARGSRLNAEDLAAVRGTLATSISSFAQANPAIERTLEDEKMAVGSAVLYAGSTQTCALLGAEKLGHFAVILYRKEGETEGNLRPFAHSLTDGKPLDSAVFLGQTHAVIARDRVVNPGWVAGDDPGEQGKRR